MRRFRCRSAGPRRDRHRTPGGGSAGGSLRWRGRATRDRHIGEPLGGTHNLSRLLGWAKAAGWQLGIARSRGQRYPEVHVVRERVDQEQLEARRKVIVLGGLADLDDRTLERAQRHHGSALAELDSLDHAGATEGAGRVSDHEVGDADAVARRVLRALPLVAFGVDRAEQEIDRVGERGDVRVGVPGDPVLDLHGGGPRDHIEGLSGGLHQSGRGVCGLRRVVAEEDVHGDFARVLVLHDQADLELARDRDGGVRSAHDHAGWHGHRRSRVVVVRGLRRGLPGASSREGIRDRWAPDGAHDEREREDRTDWANGHVPLSNQENLAEAMFQRSERRRRWQGQILVGCLSRPGHSRPVRAPPLGSRRVNAGMQQGSKACSPAATQPPAPR